MIVHTNDNTNYTITGQYCGVDFDNPGSCENAVTRTDKDSAYPALIWAIAAFDTSATPGVSVVYFGLQHNLPSAWYFAAWSLCGPAGSVEVPDGNWPASGGNSIAFSEPVVGNHLFPFYYLAAYGLLGSYLGTGVNPTGGYAAFVDDHVPPILDQVTRFGTVRWFQAGENSCPVPPTREACCLTSGNCTLLLEDECLDMQGVYFPGVPSCGKMDCAACCYRNAWTGEMLCTVTTKSDCLERFSAEGSNGVYEDPHWFQGGTCGPFGCISPDTEGSGTSKLVRTESWGSIKLMYR